MDVEEAIQAVRVVREFRPEPLPDADVRAILNAARRTGSSKNRQAWEFVVIRDRARLRELSGVGPYAGHLAGASLAIALVVPTRPGAEHPPDLWDIGRAAQNMVLIAWARGIGSVPATVYDDDLCRSILQYPTDRYCRYLLSFGYPADATDLTRPPRAGGRRPRDALVHTEIWSAR